MDPKVDLEAHWAKVSSFHRERDQSLTPTKIEDRARSARTDDFRLTRERLASWLNEPPYNCNPPLDPLKRDQRGLDNLCTCEQIFSIEYDFNNPEYVRGACALCICSNTTLTV